MPTKTLVSGGRNLRAMRKKLGFSLREVEAASERISKIHNNGEYIIPISRLSEFEVKGVIPSIYRLYSLAVIYRSELRELLSLYGVDLNIPVSELEVPARPRTFRGLANPATLYIPADSVFDPNKTTSLNHILVEWGTSPLAYLETLSKQKFTYAYVGTEDLTMYPILYPGSFVQVDESRKRVVENRWRSEYERPIYFIETREDYVCCWCRLGKDELVLEPHPLSPVASRVVSHSQSEVIGQVVGVAMRLGRAIADISLTGW